MKKMDILETKIIAHRGLHNDSIQENTIEAFKNAIKHNLPIELDIHILKDNTIVVYHDHNLKRLYKKDIPIKELDYKKLSKLTDNEVPTLEDVLNLVNGKVPILIEIKKNVKKYTLEKELVDLLDKYNGEYAIQSFNVKSIRWLKNNRPDIKRGLLLHKRLKFIDLFTINLNIRKTKPDFISVNFKFLGKRIIKKYRGKIKVFSWTIKTDDNYNKYKDMCDTLICENISKLGRK